MKPPRPQRNRMGFSGSDFVPMSANMQFDLYAFLPLVSFVSFSNTLIHFISLHLDLQNDGQIA